MKDDKSLFRALILNVLLGIGLLFYALSPLPEVPSNIYMTAAEASLTRGAITLVVNDIQSGKITSYDIALQALRSELPQSVQDDVIKRLQNSTFASISDDMVSIAGKIRIKED